MNELAPSRGTSLLEVEDMHVYFRSRDGTRDLHVVNGASFSLDRGETLSIVGESACGKTTTALAIMRLLPATGRLTARKLTFDGVDMLSLEEEELRELRGSNIAMITQDPMVALDPVYTIGSQIAEGLRLHCGLSGEALKGRQIELLELVHIPAPRTRLRQYPHQMSGGMLQRVVGAIAISANPQLLIADEPTTALDPTAQAQFLDVLDNLRERNKLAMIIVTHDFGVTARMADRVLVMYAGVVVEQGPVREIFNNPRHPYTQALLESIPHEDQAKGSGRGRLRAIEGQPPDLRRRPPGCAFAPRCPKRIDVCTEQVPERVLIDRDHEARCWRAQEQ
jgi:oligopeptide/dipeptide ABC transporter ATP-binding protein